MRGPADRPRTAPTAWPAGAEATECLSAWFAAPPETFIFANDVDFRGADLTGVDFYHLFSDHCDFSGTVLARTYLGGSYIVRTKFVEADLSQSMLTDAALVGSIFDRARLQGIILREVHAQEGSFVGADLRDAEISGYLPDCDFTDADLRNTRLDGLFSDSVVTGIRVDGARGRLRGPIVVEETGGRRVLHGTDAEEWLSARGAVVNVQPEITATGQIHPHPE